MDEMARQINGVKVSSRSPMRVPDLPKNPDWLPQRLGLPPRELPTGTFLAAWLKHRFWHGGLHPSDTLALNAQLEGQAVWGILIKAARQAFDPDSAGKTFTGVVLIAPQLPPAEALRRLPPIADWIEENRGKSHAEWPEGLTTFMDQIDDDIFHAADEVPVPSTICGELRCYIVTAVFRRKDMPGRVLGLEILPLLFLKTQHNEAYCMLVEPKLWPEPYKKQWLREASRYSKAVKKERAVSDRRIPALAALEITSLPPDRLAQIEAEIFKVCEKQHLKCLFLNMGSIADADGQPVAASGDLQFLGEEREIASTGGALVHVLKLYLSDEEMKLARLTGLDLNSFNARFGWVLDDLGKSGV